MGIYKLNEVSFPEIQYMFRIFGTVQCVYFEAYERRVFSEIALVVCLYLGGVMACL